MSMSMSPSFTDFQPTIEGLPQPATHTDLCLSLVDNLCSSGISEEVEAKPYQLVDTDNLSSTVLDNMEPPESVSTIECSPSLASHWVSPEEYSTQSLSDIVSFKSHCARLNNPGDVFTRKQLQKKGLIGCQKIIGENTKIHASSRDQLCCSLKKN